MTLIFLECYHTLSLYISIRFKSDGFSLNVGIFAICYVNDSFKRGVNRYPMIPVGERVVRVKRMCVWNFIIIRIIYINEKGEEQEFLLSI